MHTNPKLVAFGVVALVALLSVAAVPPARADTGLPVWVKGDYWQYAFTGGSGTGFTGSGTLWYGVVGTESVTSGGTPYNAYKTKMWTNVSSGGFTVNAPGAAWFRTSDLAPVKMNFTITISFLGQTVTSDTTIWYAPPPQINFPLTANATWTATSQITTESVVTGQTPSWTNTSQTVTFLVEGTASKTVQAGTFSTSSVKVTDSTGAYARSFWSWDAGNIVEQDSYSSSGSNTGSQTLQSYKYTPASSTTGGETLFGLPTYAWIVLIVVVVVVVAVVAVLLMRKPKPPVMMPPGQPGAAPPPSMPPQQPPSPPPQ